MAFSKRDQKLFSRGELSLLAKSQSAALKPMTAAQLQRLLARLRTFADKYRDVERTQARTAKRRMAAVPPQDAAHARAARKADLFGEALARVMKRQDQLARAEAREKKVSVPRGRSGAQGAKTRQVTARRAGQRPGAARQSTRSTRKAQKPKTSRKTR